VPGQILEVAVEVGQLEGLFGESDFAWPLLSRVDDQVTPATDHGEQGLYARLLLKTSDGHYVGAADDAKMFAYGKARTSVAFEARRYLADGWVKVLLGEASAAESVQIGRALAHRQGAHLWATYGDALAAAADETHDASSKVLEVARDMPVVLSMIADAVIGRLSGLSQLAAESVIAEATRRPWRWRAALRRTLESRPADSARAASLLAKIGERIDVVRLRASARGQRDHTAARLGLDLARRLADRVLVEDLGRIRIHVGGRVVEGAEVRRKVLALLCLLITRPRYTSTRDEVIDSLWPDNDPRSAANSLNQTVYFLRRVFEPDYDEDTSPGYVGQDGEIIWLDAELVEARSRRCLDIIRSMPGEPSPEGAIQLAAEYSGRFALDFAYEEWATAYRDALHAAYLRVMERSVKLDLDAGNLERGTFLAERAAEIDPDADEIQTALIRLYRLSGAHAAAAERYSHYERSMRDLGLDPIDFADV
jgi:DNA-binding SARP family transcriptional activator